MLNKIDTVPDGEREAVVRDLVARLALPAGTPVVTASGVTGEGALIRDVCRAKTQRSPVTSPPPASRRLVREPCVRSVCAPWTAKANPSGRRFRALLRLRAEAPPGLEFHRVFPWQGKPAPSRRRVFAVTGVALPDDTPERIATAFSASAGPAAVRAERRAEHWCFTLQSAKDRQAPSMKKVLQALLGDELPSGLAVRRLALGNGAGR